MTSARWQARAARLNTLDAAVRGVGDWHQPDCSLGEFLRARPSYDAEVVAVEAVRLSCVSAIQIANSIAREFADLPDTIRLLDEPYRVPLLAEELSIVIEQLADEGWDLALPSLVRTPFSPGVRA